MTGKVSIYKINNIIEVLDENNEVTGTEKVSLDDPILIDSVFATIPEESTRTVTVVEEDGTEKQVEEAYTPEFDPKYFYPEFNGDTMTYGTYGIAYPKYDIASNIVREKTRMERIADGSDFLHDGEIIKDNMIIAIPKNNEFLRPVWSGIEWIEGATDQEKEDHGNTIKNAYFSLINQYKKIIIDRGITWNGHQQKLRSAVDIPLIVGSIMSLEKMITDGNENPSKIWSFNDADNNVELHLNDFHEILIASDELVDKCFKAERLLKLKEPDLQLALSDFSSLVA